MNSEAAIKTLGFHIVKSEGIQHNICLSLVPGHYFIEGNEKTRKRSEMFEKETQEGVYVCMRLYGKTVGKIIGKKQHGIQQTVGGPTYLAGKFQNCSG